MIILYSLTCSIKAQQALFPPHHSLAFGYRNSLQTNQSSMMFVDNNKPLKQPATMSSGSINDLPFFCAMECKVHKRTNIWIKLRAGDDASYMKMIKSSSK